MQTKDISKWCFSLNKVRRGSGGRAARREARTTQKIEFSKYIERKIPNFEILNEEALEVIEHSSEEILAEIGVKFPDNELALSLWRDAGADIKEIWLEYLRSLKPLFYCTYFFYAARCRMKSVSRRRNLVCAPVYGPLLLEILREEGATQK